MKSRYKIFHRFAIVASKGTLGGWGEALIPYSKARGINAMMAVETENYTGL